MRSHILICRKHIWIGNKRLELRRANYEKTADFDAVWCAFRADDGLAKADEVLYYQSELATDLYFKNDFWRSGKFKPKRSTVKVNGNFEKFLGYGKIVHLTATMNISGIKIEFSIIITLVKHLPSIKHLKYLYFPPQALLHFCFPTRQSHMWEPTKSSNRQQTRMPTHR